MYVQVIMAMLNMVLVVCFKLLICHSFFNNYISLNSCAWSRFISFNQQTPNKPYILFQSAENYLPHGLGAPFS